MCHAASCNAGRHSGAFNIHSTVRKQQNLIDINGILRYLLPAYS